MIGIPPERRRGETMSSHRSLRSRQASDKRKESAVAFSFWQRFEQGLLQGLAAPDAELH